MIEKVNLKHIDKKCDFIADVVHDFYFNKDINVFCSIDVLYNSGSYNIVGQLHTESSSSLDELKQILKQLNMSLDDQVITIMFHYADKNDDGDIIINELRRTLNKHYNETQHQTTPETTTTVNSRGRAYTDSETGQPRTRAATDPGPRGRTNTDSGTRQPLTSEQDNS